MASIPHQFVQRSPLENVPSTDITTRRITRRCTELLWVSVLGVHVDVIEDFVVLHPRHKLHYFKTAGWKKSWIETAHAIVREEFDRTYAFMDIEGDVNPKKVWKLEPTVLFYLIHCLLAAVFGIFEYV